MNFDVLIPDDGSGDNFLYVVPEEIPEAIALGAIFLTGDFRLQIPDVLPKGVDASCYQKWMGSGAKYRWCLNLVRSVLGETSLFESHTLLDHKEETARSSSLKAAYSETDMKSRIYCYVPLCDGEEARNCSILKWDRRRKMFYTLSSKNLDFLGKWLSEGAKLVWESEQNIQSSLKSLVKNRAVVEFQNNKTENISSQSVMCDFNEDDADSLSLKNINRMEKKSQFSTLEDFLKS